VALTWGRSTDTVSLTGYIVYRQGREVARTSSTTYLDASLIDGTSYSYYVTAYDSAGRASLPSNTVSATPRASTGGGLVRGRQTSWAPVGSSPLSDAEAAALVVHAPEQRPENAAANDYVPSAGELEAFHNTAALFSPLSRYVDGLDGLSNPSTDELIQWAAAKWGVPTEWVRAQMTVESRWYQNHAGDKRTMGEAEYLEYPPQFRVSAPGCATACEAYETTSIAGIKWTPPALGNIDPGTEPLRWKSTAFAIDDYASHLRYFFDGLCGWCKPNYHAGEEWASVGAWFSPGPEWNNSGAQSYVARVQSYLSTRPWTSASF
jgi:hypothetical protein